MPNVRALFDHKGRPYRLAQQVNQGGEGAVYTLADDAGLVAKVYHAPPTDETARKLRHMVRRTESSLRERAAWPVATLHETPGGTVLGFLMPRFADCRPLHNLYLPTSRRRNFPDAEWDFLLRAAQDCAAAFAAVHAGGAVVGDVNQRNVLVSARAAVYLIDCDSFQIRADDGVFPCAVGVSDYTPPELQKRSFRGVLRTTDHDRFGLAVLIFQLLLMGKHPFAGRPTDDRTPDLEEDIRDFRFAYGRGAAAMNLGPPPGAATLEVLSPELRELFERAFGRGPDAPNRRPTAEQWSAALERFRRQLRPCTKEPAGHKTPPHLAECPWCRILDAGGPNYFAGVAAVGAEFHFDEARLTSLCQRTELAARCDLEIRRPEGAGRPRPPEPPSEELVASRTLMKIVGGVALAGAALTPGVCFFRPLALFGLGVLAVFGGWLMFLFWRSPFGREFRRRRKTVMVARQARRRAETEIAQMRVDYQSERGGMLGKTERLREGWRTLPGGYRAEYHKLEQGREALARDDFLRSRLLADHDIPKIGGGRKQTLASYNIESAFDLTEDRIRGIKGFGDVLTAALMEWRRNELALFRFDPATGVPRGEAQALALKYKQRQDGLRLRLDEEVKTLELLTRRAEQDGRSLAGGLGKFATDLAQAEANLVKLWRG